MELWKSITRHVTATARPTSSQRTTWQPKIEVQQVIIQILDFIKLLLAIVLYRGVGQNDVMLHRRSAQGSCNGAGPLKDITYHDIGFGDWTSALDWDAGVE
ncbi:hypothetical protein J1614_010299 [Plenodomus biglobosus]|nr:hypothetical protein J1614_010299 [Plenodomus biglobosus]